MHSLGTKVGKGYKRMKKQNNTTEKKEVPSGGKTVIAKLGVERPRGTKAKTKGEQRQIKRNPLRQTKERLE